MYFTTVFKLKDKFNKMKQNVKNCIKQYKIQTKSFCCSHNIF